MMKYFLIIICSLFTFTAAQSQDFIMDDQVATTAAVADDELKVLYFTASWCGPCRMMKPSITKMAADPNAVATIYKMDIDTNITDEILNVPGVPTFMFLKNGKLLGQHTGAMSDADLIALFEKHAAMKPSGDLLAYKPVPSNYKVTAGAHPKLTKENLSKVWHSEANLNKLALSIINNLNDPKDLNAGLVLINRSFEIKKSGGTLYLKTNYLNRLGLKKEALATAAEARKLIVADGQDTEVIDNLIKQMKS